MALPEEIIPANVAKLEYAVTCPYLGTVVDPHTSVGYPSGANFCHRADNPQLVSLAHQRQHCLIEAWDSCPTFRDEFIPVASIDVAGPAEREVNWKRPLAIIAIILLFGAVVFGSYAIFSPFRAETVDASTPSNQKLAETALASNTPTPAVAAVAPVAVADDTDVMPTDENQPEPTEGEAEPTDSLSENDIAEDAKMAPIVITSTPTAFLDFYQAAEDLDLDDKTGNSSVVIETTPETMPLPKAGITETELTATAAAAASTSVANGGAKIADGTAVIRTGALNVRTGPGPQFPSTALVYNGEHVILMGRNGDNSWVKVRSLNGIVGWIYAAHIEAGQPLSEIPFIPRSQR